MVTVRLHAHVHSRGVVVSSAVAVALVSALLNDNADGLVRRRRHLAKVVAHSGAAGVRRVRGVVEESVQIGVALQG